ncbi:MAG: hypothetical protein A2X59_11035 [Nitrospirae bacterium GWC2_42_7]|nr:MAG: hypothetical protein A2X59_11035 [Nitrospirae bacterium GWC2_42_7]
MAVENKGGFFIHAAHISECSDANGAEHIRHDGPEYFFMPDQHRLHKGAKAILSVELLHKGHFEG